ncbi:hypothetical protein CA54_16700 [Symmachiella macrocystis]|uniref:Uncharacterized protein n=1 Tax=Symmachiella macrocystis TaxID=2527985 RepID=A0A5C6BQD9_9PLAN|nr:hypothetical protein [Symmachiella macrocystis]TWU12844.1 hypothetical protein CA54_16700 [Symmachiella macrocystis]
MADVIKSIGTDGRDYSTVTLWNAAGGAATAADHAIGELYNDSAFDEVAVIDSGVPATITIRAADGHEHDGTAGTGVRFMRSADDSARIMLDRENCHCIGIEFDGNGYKTTTNYSPMQIGRHTNTLYAQSFQRCIAHHHDSSLNGAVFSGPSDRQSTFIRCMAWRFTYAVSTGAACAMFSSGDDKVGVFACTAYHMTRSGGHGDAILYNIHPTLGSCQNSIGLGCYTGGSHSGSVYEFTPTATDDPDRDYNMDSDGTAPGTNSVTGVTIADQFVSIVDGSEDLHLVSDADAVGAGADLLTTPPGVQYDIDGYDVDDAGDTWDIGADQYVSAGGADVVVEPDAVGAAFGAGAPSLGIVSKPAGVGAVIGAGVPSAGVAIKPAAAGAVIGAGVPSAGVAVKPAAVGAAFGVGAASAVIVAKPASTGAEWAAGDPDLSGAGFVSAVGAEFGAGDPSLSIKAKLSAAGVAFGVGDPTATIEAKPAAVGAVWGVGAVGQGGGVTAPAAGAEWGVGDPVLSGPSAVRLTIPRRVRGGRRGAVEMRGAGVVPRKVYGTRAAAVALRGVH